MSSAFGASGLPVPLSGGQGSSWRVGDLVLKPADVGKDELRWQQEALGRIGRGELLDSFFTMPFFGQFLLRALIYRAVTDALFRGDEPRRPDDSDPFLPAAEIACRYAAGW